MTTKKMYLRPEIETIEVLTEGVIAGSTTRSIETFSPSVENQNMSGSRMENINASRSASMPWHNGYK